MEELVKNLIAQGVLRTPALARAFLANDRTNFVPQEFGMDAYLDVPIPIVAGQTISQPYTVAFMIGLLEPEVSGKILDVGFGSGWTTAILASVVGPEGRIYGLEIKPQAFAFGQANLKKAGYNNVELHLGSGWDGLSDYAPYDRILVSAAAEKIPEALKDQLKIGGIMVIPVGVDGSSTVVQVKKTGPKEFKEETYPGFAFVPLINPK